MLVSHILRNGEATSRMDQVARTVPRKFSTIEDTGDLNPVTIARENLGAVHAT